MLPQTKGAQKIFKHKMLNMEHIPQLNSKNLYNVKSKILYSLAGPHAACGLPSELYRSSGTSGFRKTWLGNGGFRNTWLENGRFRNTWLENGGFRKTWLGNGGLRYVGVRI